MEFTTIIMLSYTEIYCKGIAVFYMYVRYWSHIALHTEDSEFDVRSGLRYLIYIVRRDCSFANF
jgi:hypothetical protein